jgi:hypothetical protein
MYSSKYSSTRTTGYELSPHVGWFKLGSDGVNGPALLVFRDGKLVDVVALNVRGRTLNQSVALATKLAHNARKGL